MIALSPAEFQAKLHAAFTELQGSICILSTLQVEAAALPSHKKILGRLIRELEATAANIETLEDDVRITGFAGTSVRVDTGWHAAGPNEGTKGR